MKSKSNVTKGSVWTQHLISACTKGTRLTLQGLKLLTISLAVLFPATVAFAQAVSFSPAANFITGIHPASVAIGDFNDDGKPDLATANSFGDNVSILLGTGTGAFGAATNFAVGAGPISLAIADLNGDGKLDLAVANFHGGSVSILLGTGTGGFGAATNFSAGIRPYSVAIDDLNADGKPDLVTANSGFVDDVSILLGNGSGAFGVPTNFVAGDSPAFVAIGDLNADGKPDLAVANSYTTSNKVSILLGTGSGGFLPATNFAVGTSPIYVAISDLNGDSKPDLAVANDGSLNVSILLGTGTGAFLPATNFPAGLLPASLAIADLNGDRKPDLAVVTRNDAVSILLGTGTGAFGAAKDFAVGTHPYFVAIGDLNGDGKPDLAVTNRAANSVSILLNTLTCATGGPFVVNSTADLVDANPGNGCCATASGVCTLRAAIQEANALPGDDIIILPAGTYILTIPGVNEDYSATGDLDITADLTITGPGANMTTIDAGGLDRVLEIRTGTTTNVHISGLTVTGGKTLSTQPGGGSGGGIRNGGTLILTNLTVVANSADFGGGIYNDTGGTLTINSSTVSGNSGSNQGAGIWKIGTVMLKGSTVSGNTASFGINPAGGGIMNYQDTLTLENSTVSGNVSRYGGGIITSNRGTTTNLINSTISGNTSTNGGGGIRTGQYATINLKNTIVAGNLGGGDCDISPTGNVVNSLGHNLDSDGTCKLIKPTDLPNRQLPLLGPLTNNGGSTQTHALLTGSPAIDKGGDCLAMDQRGVPRPQGAACDIGAYEVGTAKDTTPPETTISSAVDGNGMAVISSGSTLSRSITFTFGGTDAVGVAGFQCSRDGSVYAACSSPLSYSALAAGSHTFQVRALDAAGNVDASPASFIWTVITPAQAIENLITTINNMGLAGGVATSLTAPLNNINTSNKAAACAKLNAFINQVNTKVQNGQLTSAQGSQLLQAANAIKASLGC